MFKKTIIAAALLGLASAGSASVLTATGVTKSSQGILSSVGVLGGSFRGCQRCRNYRWW